MSLHPTNAMPEVWVGDLDNASLQDQTHLADSLLHLSLGKEEKTHLSASMELYWIGWLKHSPGNYSYLWRFLYYAAEAQVYRKLISQQWFDGFVTNRLTPLMQVPECETQEDAVSVWPSPNGQGYIMFAEAVAMARKMYMEKWPKEGATWPNGTGPVWYSGLGENAELKEAIAAMKNVGVTVDQSAAAFKEFAAVWKAGKPLPMWKAKKITGYTG